MIIVDQYLMILISIKIFFSHLPKKKKTVKITNERYFQKFNYFSLK